MKFYDANTKYLLIVFFAIFFVTSLFAQAKRKIVFPISVVIYSGIDSIYCFKDSLSENISLSRINSESEFIDFIKSSLTGKNLDGMEYQYYVRFFAVPFNEGGYKTWEKVFKFYSKVERKNLGFMKMNDKDEMQILKHILDTRFGKS